jgi:hypothetical protein
MARRLTNPTYDSAEQERVTTDLAATTDRELVAGIRAAFGALALRTWAWWRDLGRSTATPIQRKAHAAVEQGRRALAEIDPGDVDGAVRAVAPVLGMHWPDPVGEPAVEQLRRAAMILPRMRREARQIRDRHRPIPWQA